MKNPFTGFVALVVVVAAIIVADYTFFTVDPTTQALVLRFGQPVRDLIGAPGLYARVPFIDSVVYIDKRILALDNERQEVLVAENQRLEVDAFVRYRIADPLLFYQSVFNVKGADAQLEGMLNSALPPHAFRGFDRRHRSQPARRADGRTSAIMGEERRPRASGSTSSTCASNAPTCRRKIPKRCSAACRPSVSRLAATFPRARVAAER